VFSPEWHAICQCGLAQAPNRQWRSAANGWCLAAETQSCGDISSCTNATAAPGSQRAVVTVPCASSAQTTWQTNFSTAATVSAAAAKADPAPTAPIMTSAFSQEQLTLGFQLVAIGLPGAQCLAAEFSTPCNPAADSVVCAWQNAAVRPCNLYQEPPLEQSPEDLWVLNRTNSILRWAAAPQVGLHGPLSAAGGWCHPCPGWLC